MRRSAHDSGFGPAMVERCGSLAAVMEAGARRAAAHLNGFLDAELSRLGLPADAYALMGFSQGAMTVLFTGLRRAVAPRAILAFSGALIAPETLAARAGEPCAGAAGARRGRRCGAGATLARCGSSVARRGRAGRDGLCAAAWAWHRRDRTVHGCAELAAGVFWRRRLRFRRWWQAAV